MVLKIPIAFKNVVWSANWIYSTCIYMYIHDMCCLATYICLYMCMRECKGMQNSEL